ncbi:MAG: hypothetical protein H6716_24140 [Polyangiaceae bacterium]|nr:hypothetical protein [Polyangiaceae bacterium]
MNDNPESTRALLRTTLELLGSSAADGDIANPAAIAHRLKPRRLSTPSPGFTPPAEVAPACERARQALKSLTGVSGRWTAGERAAVLNAVRGVQSALGGAPDWSRVLGTLVEQLDEQFVVAEAAPTPSTQPHPNTQPNRRRKRKRKRKRPATVDPPIAARSHRLDKQEPADAWDVFIDETGSVFKRDANTEDHALGRVVAVALPRTLEGLDPLPADWHSCNTRGADRHDVLDEHLNRLLRAPVGIFGLSAELVPEVAGDGWASLIQRVILLTAATIPLSKPEASTLRFWVEHRGDTKSGNQTLGKETLRERLADIAPSRARVRLDVEVLEKGGDARLAWADLVAHTWARGSPHSKARLEGSGLLGDCLHEPKVAPEALWTLAMGVSPDPGQAWLQALKSQRDRKTTLNEMLLNVTNGMIASKPALWHTLLATLTAYGDGKAVDSGLYGDACSVIEDTRPPASSLPVQVELGLRIASVTRGNHLGHTDTEGLRELQDLAKKRRHNNPQLACEADLVAAVRHTNAFRFMDAHTAVAHWADGADGLPVQWQGRRLSQQGQIQAFQGQLREARGSFELALERFALLDEPERSYEQRHTATYLMIAATDDDTMPDADRRALVNAGAGILPDVLSADGLERLAASDDTAAQYVHHAVVRYLATRFDPGTSAAYTPHPEKWLTRPHHPWPLIDVWRAILLWRANPNGFDARRGALLERAIKTCRLSDHRGVISLIGETVAAVRARMGLGLGPSNEVLAELEQSLPAASSAIEVVRSANKRALDPMELMRAALPFNFR